MAQYLISGNSHRSRRPSDEVNRIGGSPIGIATEDWPRFRGRPMQHAFTLDLQGLELDVPKTKTHRALAVFVDSFFMLDYETSEGVEVVWITDEALKSHPNPAPPEDFEAEARVGSSDDDEYGGYDSDDDDDALGDYVDIDPAEEDEEDDLDNDSAFFGGEPQWSEELGEPDDVPAGAFVLQATAWELKFSPHSVVLFVFEEGAYLQRQEPDEDADPKPWAEALAETKELVVGDGPPPKGSLQRFGGVPPGDVEWPSKTDHLLTFVPDTFPEDEEDAVAISVFIRLSRDSNWGEQPGFIYCEFVTQEQLDGTPSVPEGVTVLPEKELTLRSLAPDARWRDLRGRSFVGPRPVWRDPTASSASDTEDFLFQLSEALLPSAPGPGTLFFNNSGAYPWWQPEPNAPQRTKEEYRPDGTLYRSDTASAVVVGWRLKLEDEPCLGERFEQLEQALLSVARERGIEDIPRLYVTGDTTASDDTATYAGLVFGRGLAVTYNTDEGLAPITLELRDKAQARLPDLGADFWEAVGERCEGLVAEPKPEVYLIAWGPLCYGALYVGVPMSASDRDSAKYTYAGNQDMEQESSPRGVDGVMIDTCDFCDVSTVELTEQSLAEMRAKVPELADAGLWLLCRYD